MFPRSRTRFDFPTRPPVKGRARVVIGEAFARCSITVEARGLPPHEVTFQLIVHAFDSIRPGGYDCEGVRATTHARVLRCIDGLTSSISPTSAVCPSALVRDRRSGCVRAGTGPEVVSVPGTLLTAQIAGLAGGSSPSHQQGRLVHLAIGEGRRGAGRHGDGQQAEDEGVSHGHAHCSLGDHGATAPARTALKHGARLRGSRHRTAASRPH